jgi:broad specificity phosphatase PhoE
VTRVFLVRHAETDWNRDEVFRGRADRPLSERGRRQAEAVGRAFAPRPLRAVYSAPLLRARETAEPIARPHGLPVVLEEGLNDLDFGAWQGLAKAEVRERHAELYRQWESAPHTVVFPGGEGLAEVQGRAAAALDSIVRRHPEQAVAVITHRVVLKVLLGELLGAGLEAFWRFRFDTTSVTVLRFGRRGPELEGFNDTAHLAGVDDQARGSDV